MATRAVVAVGTPREWHGRYVHNDGYPTAAGPKLLSIIEKQFDGDAAAAADFLVEQHPAGWSVLGETCYCHTPNPKAPQTYTAENVADSMVEWVYIIDTEQCRIWVARNDVEEIDVEYAFEVWYDDGGPSSDFWSELEAPIEE